MSRAKWGEDRRMQKFRDVLSRWERRELSMLEAGELLGCSERQVPALAGSPRGGGACGLGRPASWQGFGPARPRGRGRAHAHALPDRIPGLEREALP